ncbi:MAG: holo-ACP synthase [Bacillota bacterium]|uniref:Holo-[acyl-carrier-protein] synthase n=1 Tax=Virgibacillus salarius TaxID=447199 RepID=A0A941DVL0_9BACI|nr:MULTISPECIES: holo-ACP synthase [Bacillaceae]NAZ08949.1 holo-[acyl-carrier-protein] synthase [Agaribacter marinus]MBR7796241.1 holo-ACP synthase [Virgibacillus salarius]MCC2251638.1 holo-ACP synthase [Virgibacillus sp. AGTR]MDY7045150.1 holo-ACP synthase [Virgibacillus sp. M23]QRZ19672.1 holo-ACP synthase [Virgibacillus sp. AGTR]
MIRGIGIDLIELYRIENSMQRTPRIIERILTPIERERFYALHNKRRQVEFLAGRFAAKEAFAKAVGIGIGRLSFQDIEIQIGENGAPILHAKGYGKEKIFLSITHTADYAAAQIVIEAL